MTEESLEQQLEAARATVASQAMQIHRLQSELESRGGAGVLRGVLELSDIVSATVGQTPYRSLLGGIVEAARRIFDARAASVLLLDEETSELVFEASTDGDAILNVRFPAHQGIAGWVMMTGEPIAVADVTRDPRFAKDFAKSTGYVPKSILAVPLIVREDVIGVLEVLDKASAASFGLDDMELLGLFARPAAIGVEQARMVSTVGRLLIEELESAAAGRGDTALAGAARSALSDGNDAIEETLQLARLVQRIGRRGDRSRQLAVDVLGSIARNAG
jgi:GAF domain-containing protein